MALPAKLVALLGSGAVAASAAAYFAIAPAAGPGDPCDADLRRLCGEIAPGGGAWLRCLVEHEDEVAPACRAAMDKRQGRRRDRGQQPRPVCGDDVARLCGDVEPGNGGLARCLREHAGEISEPCREAAQKRAR